MTPARAGFYHKLRDEEPVRYVPEKPIHYREQIRGDIRNFTAGRYIF